MCPTDFKKNPKTTFKDAEHFDHLVLRETGGEKVEYVVEMHADAFLSEDDVRMLSKE